MKASTLNLRYPSIVRCYCKAGFFRFSYFRIQLKSRGIADSLRPPLAREGDGAARALLRMSRRVRFRKRFGRVPTQLARAEGAWRGWQVNNEIQKKLELLKYLFPYQRKR